MDEIEQTLRDGLAEVGDTTHWPLTAFSSQLSVIWKSPELRVRASLPVRRALPMPSNSPLRTRHESVCENLPHYEEKPHRPPPWYLGMSRAFTKSISEIDRKMQGRILVAIADICADPVTPRGDTVKPLRAELNGCWRYRIGDFRLIYSPDAKTGDITLLAFAGRGSIYED